MKFLGGGPKTFVNQTHSLPVPVCNVCAAATGSTRVPDPLRSQVVVKRDLWCALGPLPSQSGVEECMALRNSTLFLGRLVCINRSDDFYKWDPRDQQYMRLYDGKGNLIVEGTLSQQLNQMIMADGFIYFHLRPFIDRENVL